MILLESTINLGLLASEVRFPLRQNGGDITDGTISIVPTNTWSGGAVVTLEWSVDNVNWYGFDSITGGSAQTFTAAGQIHRINSARGGLRAKAHLRARVTTAGTSGQLAQVAFVGTSHADSGTANESDGWTTLILAADFANATTSQNAVTGMSFTPAASSVYVFGGDFMCTTTAATTGPQPGISWPTGATRQSGIIVMSNSATSHNVRYFGSNSTALAASTGLPDTTNSYYGYCQGIIKTEAGTTGSVGIVLASETAAVSVSMMAGSCLRYRKIE